MAHVVYLDNTPARRGNVFKLSPRRKLAGTDGSNPFVGLLLSEMDDPRYE